MPLNVAILVVCCALPDLKQPHCHPGSHFCELHALVSRLDEHVMSNFYAVLDVLESDDS